MARPCLNPLAWTRSPRSRIHQALAHDGDGITVNISGVNEKWPTVHATVLANLEEEAGQRTAALLATFDLGFMVADTHIRVNKGVLVIVLYVIWHDDSGRSNYLNREFFYRAE